MYNSDLPKREDLPSSAQLMRSTLIALCIAGGLLVTVVLPAEYGVDPTRIGGVLGLTNMGEIKQQLAQEAEQDALMSDQSGAETMVESPAEQSSAIGADPSSVERVDQAEVQAETAVWADETVAVLKPGESTEIKLIMMEGGVATFEWVSDVGHLNSALHGDGTKGQSITYRNGRAEVRHEGELVAAFDGSHGWFWRNRSEQTVTMTLRTKGQYSEIRRFP